MNNLLIQYISKQLKYLNKYLNIWNVKIKESLSQMLIVCKPVHFIPSSTYPRSIQICLHSRSASRPASLLPPKYVTYRRSMRIPNSWVSSSRAILQARCYRGRWGSVWAEEKIISGRGHLKSTTYTSHQKDTDTIDKQFLTSFSTYNK